MLRLQETLESSKDVKLISDETLDFELLSPLDGSVCCYREEGEKSVTCPLELSDKSVAPAVDLNSLLEGNDGRAKEPTPQWSPLTPNRMEEVTKEANLLVMQLKKCQRVEKNFSSETKPETVTSGNKKVEWQDGSSPIRRVDCEDCA